MREKFNNMNLKTKASIGFAMVFLIMFLSAMVGFLGLLDNGRKFDTFYKLTEEGQLSNEIDSYQYAQRLAFKKYETGNDIEFLNQYKEIEVNKKEAIDRFNKISKDKQRKNYMQQIIDSSTVYQENFDAYIILSQDIAVTYKELVASGAELTNALKIMQETAQKTNNIEMYTIISNNLGNILSARLSASKYFNLHLVEDYDQFILSYRTFEKGFNLLEGIQEEIEYKVEYYTLEKYIPLYKSAMEKLQEQIKGLDKINVEMDVIGPEISELTMKIYSSNIGEVNFINDKLVASNQRNSLLVGIIFLLAVVAGSFVAIRILKIVTNPINLLKDTFESIASSDANTDFRLAETSKDEIGKMSKAFNVFMIKINTMMENVRNQNLLKTAETDIYEIVRLEDDINIISDRVIAYLCKNLNMLIGAIYIPNENETFQLTASYAYTNRKGVGTNVEVGEGIIGQVIKEPKLYMIHDLPEDYILVQSGLGDAKPTSVIIVPCLNAGELVGIIELASFVSLESSQISMIEALSEVLGRILSSVNVRHKMKKLLEKTLNLSESLKVQQEELRQSNEELEEQARALKESEGKLQVQQEELRVTNEELETHSRQLEDQKRILNEKNNTLITVQKEMGIRAEALEKANKYKSEFLANMSHELRTPLNSILVLSQLLSSRESDETLSEKEKQFASTIYSSGNDLLTLINGVLDLSKVEAGKLQVHNENVYLTELLEENKNMFESMAEQKELEFMISIEADMPEYIVTDSLRLNQIMKNLISNSIKFTHEGNVSVRIRNLRETETKALILEPGVYIGIEVTDTGIGIPKDKQKEVFEAFKQSDGTTSRQYGGTGLGLTISLEMAKLLGGNIILESEVNIGSQFLLVVPKNPMVDKRELNLINTIEMMEHYDIENESKKTTSKVEEDPNTNTKRILIIEDDPTFSQILCDLAEGKGYVVTQAHTGKEGIKRAKKDKPTGIILDIGLPDIDGIILAKILSEDESTKNIPIHVISGSDDYSEEVNFEDMPKSIIGFLKKPVDIKAIYKTLAKIESVNKKGSNKILVVGSCGEENFHKFTQMGKVVIKKVLTGKEAIEELKIEMYEGIILDIKLSDTNGVDFMTKLRQELNIQTPIIIYTDEEINSDEIDDINKYAETIILKSAKSKDRLVDEVSLFLHDVQKNVKDNRPVDRIIQDDKNALRGVRVLLADDDNRNIFALMHLLEQYGMKVIIAKDGIEAVKQFNENEVGLVLMDIMMPNMDGYEAIKQIRNTGKGRNIPIIALTAKAMSDDRDKCISAGANDYFTKPVDASRLLSMIKVWLS